MPTDQPVAETPVSSETTDAGREAELAKWIEKRGPKLAPEPSDARETPAESVSAPVETPDETTDETDRDEQGRFRKRAKSQRATAEDVPRIRTLTAKLREAEADRDTTKAERDALKAEIEQLRAGKSAPAAEPVKTDSQPPPAEAKTFDKPKPLLHEFGTYEEWAEALTEWNLDKREFTAKQKADAEKAEKAGQANLTKLQSEFRDHVAAYAKATPDYDAVIKAAPSEPMPDLVHWAILTAGEDGPKYAYALAKSPGLVYEVMLLADGKTVNDQSVALMRRFLAAHVAAVSPGSAPVMTSTSRASAPVKPVGASPMSAEVSPDSMTGNQFRNWYHAREKARRTRA